MVEYAATQGISEAVRWLMMHPTQQRNHTQKAWQSTVVRLLPAPIETGAPAGGHLGMRHRPGLRDGAGPCPVRPTVIAPRKL
jgi:hypothetical protein